MPRARLDVDVPEGSWLRDVSTARPGSTIRVVAALAREGGGTAVVAFHDADPAALLGDLRDHPGVVDLELLRSADGRTLVQVETTESRLHGPLRRAGVPLATPFEVRDGEASWTLTATPDRLAALGRGLDRAGIDSRLEAVAPAGSLEPDAPGLTDRQREVLARAYERGYYASPRGTTLTALADDLGVSKSTASELLHRAEGRLVEWFHAAPGTAD